MAMTPESRLTGTVGYGFFAPVWRGLATPFVELDAGASGRQRAGVLLERGAWGPRLELSVERAPSYGDVGGDAVDDHAVSPGLERVAGDAERTQVDGKAEAVPHRAADEDAAVAGADAGRVRVQVHEAFGLGRGVPGGLDGEAQGHGHQYCGRAC